MARKQDPAWLAGQYNNRARVPDHAEILARWARDSQAIRDTRPCQLDLAYGDTPAERLDVFRPSDAAREPKARRRPGAPMLVFIHGGWWRSLDKADHSFVTPALADAGAVVVVPNYALCPAVGIEDIALQMVRSLAWCWRHARELGADPERITVAGHSAGGHLAAMMLCTLWKRVGNDLPDDLVRAALSISGVFDLEPLRRTPFFEFHVAAGGRMIDFGGWELPVQYAGLTAEHKTVRSAVGLFDVSHMGEIRVRGAKALDAVRHLVANDGLDLFLGHVLQQPGGHRHQGRVL